MRPFFFSFFLAVIMASCFTGRLMTMKTFYEIPIGSTPEIIVASFGEPELITEEEDGALVYHYVERLTNGFRVVEERYYSLVFQEGSLVEKKLSQENEPPYYRNSYDLQTTQGGENALDED